MSYSCADCGAEGCTLYSTAFGPYRCAGYNYGPDDQAQDDFDNGADECAERTMEEPQP